MKKNITINMFGQLYNIDEDAYELLNNYEEALRQYFRKQEEGAEIANDIEARIAELFSELKAKGVEAITIEHVQDIIKRIGKPEEIEGETLQNSDADPLKANAGQESGKRHKGNNKNLFRDGQNKMLGGVLAGLSNYFGGDVLFWRLGYMLLIILPSVTIRPSLFRVNFEISFWLILLYLVLFFILPEAKTPEDKLKMKGCEVTPETLAEEVAKEARQEEAGGGTAGNNNAKGCLKAFFDILGMCIKVCCIIIGMMLIIPLLVFIFFDVAYAVAPRLFATEMFDEEVYQILQHSQFVVWGLNVCILIVCFIPVYCSVHALLTMVKKTQPMDILQRILLFCLWFLSAVGIVCFGLKIKQVSSEFSQQKDQQEIAANTHDGVVFVSSDEWEFFQKNKWKAVVNKNNENQTWIGGDLWPDWTSSGSYFNGNSSVRYLDANGANVEYQVERTDTIAKGSYTLSYVARATGQGAVVFVKSTEWKEDIIVPIKAYGGEGGPIWEEAKKGTPIAEANDGKGAGWARYDIKFFMDEDGTVTYGVKVSPELSTPEDPFVWFSATDFKLYKNNNQP